ncbi:MAG: four helix bundle protein [Chthoniobacterales bacterium]
MERSRVERARELQDRTKKFALQIIRTFAQLPKTEEARVLGRQFLRSGTSVAANYRAACRARSAADFISKISVVTEETDETLFWLELTVEAKMMRAEDLESAIKECGELLKIFSASLATAKVNR